MTKTDPTPTWQTRVRQPRLLSATLAKSNHDRGLVVTNQFSDTYDICAWTVSTGEQRPLTNDPDGHTSGLISPDGTCVFFLKDDQGSELGHLVRLPFEGGDIEDITPDMKDYTLRGTGFSQDASSFAFTAVNREGFQLCHIAMGPNGEISPVRVIHTRRKETWGGPLSYDGKLCGAMSTARADGMRYYSLLAIDADTGNVIGELWDGPGISVELASFAPFAGDARLLGMTTKSGFRRPVIWDPRSDNRVDFTLDALDGEIMPLAWHPDGTRILVCQLYRGEGQLHLVNLTTQEHVAVQQPEGTLYSPGLGVPCDNLGPSFDTDGNIICMRRSANLPPQLDVISTKEPGAVRTVLKIETGDNGRPWKSVLFNSSDGQEIQGWLSLPDGEPPFPAVVYVHGGPHMISLNEAEPKNQSWTDMGYAFLSINYRGSAMFGQAFKEKIWGDIGHWEMEDIAAGRSWLVSQGIARPEAIFLHGQSYGGFLTLWGVGTRPDLWAGGIAGVAIADWTASYEDASDALKAAVAAWHRGAPEEKRELYVERSPITYADKVTAPVLIIQGRADSRTPARQVEMYEEKMKALGKDIEVHWFDEGHFVSDPETVIAFQQRRLDFIARTLAALTDHP